MFKCGAATEFWDEEILGPRPLMSLLSHVSLSGNAQKATAPENSKVAVDLPGL